MGITMLELANNHAPYSNLPPTKVFLLKVRLGFQSNTGQIETNRQSSG